MILFSVRFVFGRFNQAIYDYGTRTVVVVSTPISFVIIVVSYTLIVQRLHGQGRRVGPTSAATTSAVSGNNRAGDARARYYM